jgi:hypothetical protein
VLARVDKTGHCDPTEFLLLLLLLFLLLSVWQCLCGVAFVISNCEHASMLMSTCAGLKDGQLNKPQTFTIETRGAGQGGVGLSVVGPTEPCDYMS